MNDTFKEKGTPWTRRRVIGGVVVAAVLIVVAACGGGDGATTSDREQPLAVSNARAITWAPTSITMKVNPGAKQGIPVTFVAQSAMSNVTVNVVPELRKMITVTPTSLGSLKAGQTATITINFAPSTSEALRTVSGTIRVLAGFATTSSPLPVSISLVAPEVIGGIAVPPEPPVELNNLTLAGFDTNGNGVRDDVERVLVSKFGGKTDLSYALATAKEYQTQITAPTPTTRAAALVQVGRQFCAIEGASSEVYGSGFRDAVANTEIRKLAFRAFDDVLISFTPLELPSCAN